MHIIILLYGAAEHRLSAAIASCHDDDDDDDDDDYYYYYEKIEKLRRSTKVFYFNIMLWQYISLVRTCKNECLLE